MIKYEELTGTQLRKIAKIIKKCYDCGKPITCWHRINRGYAGGKYTLKNIDFLCNECHRQRHEKERMGRK